MMGKKSYGMSGSMKMKNRMKKKAAKKKAAKKKAARKKKMMR